MKKLVILTLVICLLMSGCAFGGSVPETTAAPRFTFTLYTPNANADGFDTSTADLPELAPEGILRLLISAEVLQEGITLNSAVLEGSQLNLDFNGAFRQQLMGYGTAGEHMMVGSVVNTFLSAYGCETVYLTVDGGILESGHILYDFPLEMYQ